MEPHLSCPDDCLSAQRTAESDYLEAPLTEEGISAQHSCLNSEHGEDVYAHESDNWSFSIHGEDVSAHSSFANETGNYGTIAHKHRPRRSAAQRRAQHRRANTRMTTKLLSGLLELDTHRGCSLNHVGKALLEALRSTRDDAAGDDTYNITTHVNLERAQSRVCRHWLVGRCTYGVACRFMHDDVPDAGRNDAESTADNREHGVSSEHEAAFQSSCSSSGLRYHDDGTESIAAHDVEADEYDNVRHGDIHECRDDCKRTRLLLEQFDKIVTDLVHIEASPTFGDHDDGIHNSSGQDEVDDIIGVLIAIPPEDVELHFEQLSRHLQDEVRQRLRQLGAHANCNLVPTNNSSFDDALSRIATVIARSVSYSPHAVFRGSETVLPHEPDDTSSSPSTVAFAHDNHAFDREDPTHQLVIEEYEADCDTMYSTLLNNANRNQKVARRRYRATIESLDDAKVTSMLRYVASQETDQQRILMQDLPPECGPLEKLAMKLSYNAYRCGLDIDIAISRALQIVRHDISSAP